MIWQKWPAIALLAFIGVADLVLYAVLQAHHQHGLLVLLDLIGGLANTALAGALIYFRLKFNKLPEPPTAQDYNKEFFQALKKQWPGGEDKG